MRKDNSSIPCPDSVRTDRGSNRWLRGSGWGESLVANTGSNGIGLGVLIAPFESLISASESSLVNANLSVGQKGDGVTTPTAHPRSTGTAIQRCWAHVAGPLCHF